ncbi:3-deoxy-7-phosphoheptulonate synthase [Streptomyces sp. NPDC056361]|uniref:3-deoxy-7-phosphoheptulonate synthase n=1 Tax=Streptomyces sp. NPDC056361 TaxID=3345795 RepID=UPI0035D9B3B0
MPSPDSPADAATLRAEPAVPPDPVTREEIETLRLLLARAAAGEYQVLQAGDPVAGTRLGGDRSAVAREAGLLDALAGIMRVNSGRPVLRIARERANHGLRPSGDPLWTSREVLAPDDELPFLRRTPTGRPLLASTHLPWLGEHALRPDGARAGLLARVANPIACEVGPHTTPDELVRLCRVLDPDRTPGRLTLVSRMGVNRAASELPRLVAAVRRAGHPSAWLCDPMGGNTFTALSGHRSQLVSMVIEEVVAFQRAVVEAGGVAAGLRLPTTPDSVTECAWGFGDADRVAERATPPRDPRLNAQQAFTVVGAWGPPPRPGVGA